MNRHLAYLLSSFFIMACGNPSGVQDSAPVNPTQPSAAEASAAAPSEEAASPAVLLSKGVIRSSNEVNVYSRIEGQLQDVKLLEGQRVRKGQTLFTLDDWDLKGKVLLSESSKEQAQVRLEEILIGQGYKRDNFSAVPENVMKYAMVKSGLNVAERELELNRARLSRTVITAPMSGLLTGIKPLPYSFVSPGETLCRIVDPDHLIIEFSILETELSRFKVGLPVTIKAIAYSEVSHVAVIRSIGSVVDEAGMIKIEASIEDSTDLLPGMTAIVSL